MKRMLKRLGALAALAAAACGDGGGGATTPSRITPPAPAVTVTASFAENAANVTEGETVEIGIEYRVTNLASPLQLTVSPLDSGTVPADYELSATSVEIPAGQSASGTRILSLSALTDSELDEGDEVLSLRLVPLSGVPAELGQDLEITIADAGVAPCAGVRVRARPITPLETVPHWLATSITVSRNTDGGRVWFDWEGPYRHDEECDNDDCREWWASNSPAFEVNLVEWRIESSDGSTDHVLDVEWRREKEAGLRFRSPDGACESGATVACTNSGCELIPEPLAMDARPTALWRRRATNPRAPGGEPLRSGSSGRS